MPPPPISTLRHCTNCITSDFSPPHRLLTAVDDHETTRLHLILLLCGITATVITAGAGTALLSRILIRRLRRKREQAFLGQLPSLPLLLHRVSRERGGERSSKSANIGKDKELQDPFSASLNRDEERSVGYTEVQPEGLGVHFVDVDLGMMMLGMAEEVRLGGSLGGVRAWYECYYRVLWSFSR